MSLHCTYMRTYLSCLADLEGQQCDGGGPGCQRGEGSGCGTEEGVPAIRHHGDGQPPGQVQGEETERGDCSKRGSGRRLLDC